MQKTKNGTVKISGIIISICALGITILNAVQGNNMDSYIMPFILLMLGMSLLFRKQGEEKAQIKLGKRPRRIVIAALSISLLSGILMMLLFI